MILLRLILLMVVLYHCSSVKYTWIDPDFGRSEIVSKGKLALGGVIYAGNKKVPEEQIKEMNTYVPKLLPLYASDIQTVPYEEVVRLAGPKDFQLIQESIKKFVCLTDEQAASLRKKLNMKYILFILVDDDRISNRTYKVTTNTPLGNAGNVAVAISSTSEIAETKRDVMVLGIYYNLDKNSIAWKALAHKFQLTAKEVTDSKNVQYPPETPLLTLTSPLIESIVNYFP